MEQEIVPVLIVITDIVLDAMVLDIHIMAVININVCIAGRENVLFAAEETDAPLVPGKGM